MNVFEQRYADLFRISVEDYGYSVGPSVNLRTVLYFASGVGDPGQLGYVPGGHKRRPLIAEAWKFQAEDLLDIKGLRASIWNESTNNFKNVGDDWEYLLQFILERPPRYPEVEGLNRTKQNAIAFLRALNEINRSPKGADWTVRRKRGRPSQAELLKRSGIVSGYIHSKSGFRDRKTLEELFAALDKNAVPLPRNSDGLECFPGCTQWRDLLLERKHLKRAVAILNDSRWPRKKRNVRN